MRRGTLRAGLGVATAVVVATSAGCSSAASQESQDALAAAKQDGIRVATSGANPPWSFLGADNKFTGYDIDMSREIAKRIGVDRVTFVQDTFQNFVPALRNNKYDMVVSGQTITAARAKQVAFTRPYEVNPVAIFVQPNSTIKGKRDLQGKRIAVSAGSTQEQDAREIEGANVLTYNNATLALTDLSRGKADAYLGSKFVGAYLAQKNNLDVKPLSNSLSSEVNAITVRKGDQSLLKAVNKALGAMVTDGTVSKISKRWLGDLDMAPELARVPKDPAKVAATE